jgi:large subunit ribosomal protein L24
MKKLRIKKGDTVKVLSGKDKGKTGKVIRVLPQAGRVVVEAVNVHTKFERSKKAGQPGMRITTPSPMSVSKVMLVDPHSGHPTRVGYQILNNGTKQRMAKQSGKAI